MKKIHFYPNFILIFLISYQGFSQDKLAFPGAEGFGKYTTGGREGTVVIVTNLNDAGKGSLRAAIEKDFPRTVVFEVSGTISLQSALEINNGDITIAGHSAPGDGITIRNYPLKINADNVIVRYIRSRLGDTEKQQDDAISVIGNKDIIIDHCSFSWGTDESASCYDNENFTMQWCIISESLNNSVHIKGEHGYGGIWGGKGASFHHNLLAHHKSRNPRLNGARTQPSKVELVDFRNNIIYNWRTNSTYAGENGNYNMINNYYKKGPATSKSTKNRIVNPWSPYGKFYIEGNYVFGEEAVTHNNLLGIYAEHVDSAIASHPFDVSLIEGQSAVDAFSLVLTNAGASHERDDVDRRIIEEVKNGTACYGEKKDGIIDSQADVGGWPVLRTRKAPVDNDKDGMPDEWEIKNGLDPKDPSDHSGYLLSDGYTNIEVYLNQIIEPTYKNE